MACALAFPAFTWPNNRSGVEKCEVSLGCIFGGQVASNTRDCPRQSVHERYSYDKRTPSTDDICPCALSFAPSASLVLSVTSQRDRGIGYSNGNQASFCWGRIRSSVSYFLLHLPISNKDGTTHAHTQKQISGCSVSYIRSQGTLMTLRQFLTPDRLKSDNPYGKKVSQSTTLTFNDIGLGLGLEFGLDPQLGVWKDVSKTRLAGLHSFG